MNDILCTVILCDPIRHVIPVAVRRVANLLTYLLTLRSLAHVRLQVCRVLASFDMRNGRRRRVSDRLCQLYCVVLACAATSAVAASIDENTRSQQQT